jgi:hypothetical protein
LDPTEPILSLARMARMHNTWPAALLAILLVGCSKNEESRAQSGAPGSPATAARVAEDSRDPRPGETLVGRLAREAENRPQIKPNADDVLARLDAAGARVALRKPNLGATHKAAYCTGGYTGDNALAFTVCEYADESSATAGRDYDKSLFPEMKNREVRRRKATTLAVVQLKDDASTAALQRKAIAGYESL